MSSRRLTIAAGMVALLSGCASLPSSGPTARQITRGATDATGTPAFAIVDLDAGAVAALSTPAADLSRSRLGALARAVVPDVVGPGDVLSITLYEVGISLFAGRARDSGGTFDPSAHSEIFPQQAVSAAGEIELPYMGSLHVAGRSPHEIAAQIDAVFRTKSQSPQAVVTIARNVFNTVFVGGDVRRPARLELTASHERLLDAITMSGGTASSADDVVVRVTRNGQAAEQRLSTILSGSPDDLTLLADDRVELIRVPRSYTVFGATPKVSQVAFESASISLAEALARAGGPNDGAADPRGVFLFRYQNGPSAPDGRPVVYRLDMRQPASYFLAQRVMMRDKDLIYIANSAANQPLKLVSVIGQLFSPFVAVRDASR